MEQEEEIVMNKYKVTLLIPHEHTIEAPDLGAAHGAANKLLRASKTADGVPSAVLHSVTEVKDCNVLNFGPSPAASA